MFPAILFRSLKFRTGHHLRFYHTCMKIFQPVLPGNTECSICHQTTNTPPPEVDDEQEDYSLRYDKHNDVCNSRKVIGTLHTVNDVSKF